jgi:membrane glycosyltransferase
LQHLRLIFSRGFFPAHRALFLNGILSYGSALLWLAFLLISSAQAVAEVYLEPVYFLDTKTLFPQWPVWRPHWALALLGSTAVLLVLPKFFSYALALLRDPAARLYRGGSGSPAHSAGGGALHAAGARADAASQRLHPLDHSGQKRRLADPIPRRPGNPWADAVDVHWWGTILGILWARSST